MKNESELLEKIARKASVPVTTVRAVVDALQAEAGEGRVSEAILGTKDAAHLPISPHTDPSAIDELIARAGKHPLGLEFLRDGYLGSVAAEFGAHAFTVEAARLRLRSQGRTEDAS